MTTLPSAVLFCCSFNAVRSAMAEWLLKHYHGHQIYIDSAGVKAEEVNPFAVAALSEFGVDMSGHKPKTFDDLTDDSFDLVISLSPEAHHRAIEMTRTSAVDVEYWKTFDPTMVEGNREQMLSAFRDVAQSLDARIRERFPPPENAEGG